MEEELLREYPDLSQSMVRDVFRSVEEDSVQAHQILKRFATNEPTPEEIQRKLQEVSSFESLGQEQLLKTLRENRWDVEKALIPLFGLLEDKQKEERQKKYEEERNRRAAEARIQANHFLKELFGAVPEEQIQKMLDENDGDVDTTTEQLIELMGKENEKQKEEKEEEKMRKERQQNRDALAIRFSKSEDEVEQILLNLNWNVQAAIKHLLKMEQDQKYNRFAKLYSFRRAEEVRHVLEINDYDETRTMKYLDDKIQQENYEIQKNKEKN